MNGMMSENGTDDDAFSAMPSYLRQEENDVLSHTVIVALHSLGGIAATESNEVAERLEASWMILEYARRLSDYDIEESDEDGGEE